MPDTGWLPALAGGLVIGAGAVVLMLLLGRIAGISGIVGALLTPARPRAPLRAEGPPADKTPADDRANRGWRLAFVAGLLAGPLLVGGLTGSWPDVRVDAPLLAVCAAGLLVGVGTQMGHGCTSGHGVCGLARLSPRSLVATIVFMGAAGVVVFVLRHLLVAW